MARQASSKKFLGKIIGSKIFLFVITLILIALTISLSRESYQKYQLSKEIESLQQEIERLEGGNRQLGDFMAYLKDDAYAEKEARLKLNLKKEGENVIIFPDGFGERAAGSTTEIRDELEAAGYAPDSKRTKETPNYWKWWEYFFAS